MNLTPKPEEHCIGTARMGKNVSASQNSNSLEGEHP
jgi:hypothetical protein